MGNGQCERLNQTLMKMLGSMEEKNSTFHDNTGYSPFFLMFRLAILMISPGNSSATSQQSDRKHQKAKTAARLRIQDRKRRCQAEHISTSIRVLWPLSKELWTAGASWLCSDKECWHPWQAKVSRLLGEATLCHRVTAWSICIGPDKDRLCT